MAERGRTENEGPATRVIPRNLLEKVMERKCILFLGAMASARPPKESPWNRKYTCAPPSGAELSKSLANQCDYPYEDTSNLQRVSLYFQYKEDQNRQTLIEAMRREVNKDGIIPSPALHMLAALPFPIIITTNYDNLFDRALSKARTKEGKEKQPVIRVYRPDWNDRPDSVPAEPTEETPILLKVHGTFDQPDSVVVTEEDYLHFVQKMSNNDVHPIHFRIRSKMMDWPVLFIGYSLRDYNFRLLFRTLRWQLPEADMRLYYSVDPKPDGVIALVSQRNTRFNVSFVRSDLWDFVPDLYKAWNGEAYQ